MNFTYRTKGSAIDRRLVFIDRNPQAGKHNIPNGSKRISHRVLVDAAYRREVRSRSILYQHGVIGSNVALRGQGIGSNPVVGWHTASAIMGTLKLVP